MFFWSIEGSDYYVTSYYNTTIHAERGAGLKLADRTGLSLGAWRCVRFSSAHGAMPDVATGSNTHIQQH